MSFYIFFSNSLDKTMHTVDIRCIQVLPVNFKNTNTFVEQWRPWWADFQGTLPQVRSVFFVCLLLSSGREEGPCETELHPSYHTTTGPWSGPVRCPPGGESGCHSPSPSPARYARTGLSASHLVSLQSNRQAMSHPASHLHRSWVQWWIHGQVSSLRLPCFWHSVAHWGRCETACGCRGRSNSSQRRNHWLGRVSGWCCQALCSGCQVLQSRWIA